MFQTHVRALSDKVRNWLDDAVSVLGIVKPNANTEVSTTTLHLENLTKKDLIIFFGGTKDISKNESKKGLLSLIDFARRSINTNVILLRVPHRYDLSSSSCINSEINWFNNKLQSLMSVFNHVRVLNVLTERLHHTNHGLHLNKKGKNWIVNNLVKEIKNLHPARREVSLIVLPWKDARQIIPHQNHHTVPSARKLEIVWIVLMLI